MLAIQADKAETSRVADITGPLYADRNGLEKLLAAQEDEISRLEPQLVEAYARYDRVRDKADRCPRDIRVAQQLGSAASQLCTIETELKRARSVLLKIVHKVERIDNELRRLQAEHVPGRNERCTAYYLLYQRSAERRNKLTALVATVEGIWETWSAEERVTHFEAADFDFGLFLKHSYVDQLLQAYAEVRHQYAPPRHGFLDMLISWVRDGRRRRPTKSPLWGEMTLLR
ncbi:hypothetical protein EG329_001169 [Mollisiaceae sp. DMI_Dod_QoI]|nr:hypothetical protein EG329_001169 [Helotiales sp. DMI_Dod_QoI]